MHFYMLNIIEEIDSEYKSELKLWENTEGNIWMQVGYDEMEPNGVHGIVLTKDDAVALIKELTRLVGYVPTQEIKSHTSKQLAITPEKPLQKVNWNK